jgi:hypothetical protein
MEIAKNAGKMVFSPQIFRFPMVSKEVRGSMSTGKVCRFSPPLGACFPAAAHEVP